MEIADITTHIRRLKRLLRTTWTRPMAPEQRELSELKRRATELCALRAFSRGRFHLQTGFTTGLEAVLYHQRIAERLGPAFALAPRECA
ncbi:MAG TPA: hypothetical protein VF103_17045 [Polyangiaceae bacterium]